MEGAAVGAEPGLARDRDALARSRRAPWLPVADWEALLELPLDEVRAQLSLGDPPVYTPLRSAGAPALEAQGA